MELDKRLVQSRVDIIERNLEEIKQIVKSGMKTYLEELASKHALLESIEACIDISNHIISVKRFRRPLDYKDIFVILEENKIIKKSLSEKLQKMAKFRNVLVHRYSMVDKNRLLQIMKEDVKDIKEFVLVVLRL